MEYRLTSCSLMPGVIQMGCNTHKKVSDKILTYYNTTMPTPIPVQGQQNGGGACDCTVNYNSTGSGTDWQSSFSSDAETWQGSQTDMLIVQSYASGSIEDFGKCYNYGFKNVSAKKQWHGAFNWLSRDACGPTSSDSPDQIKYTNYSPNFAFNYLSYTINTDEQPVSVQQEGGSGGTISVNATTGIITNGLTTSQDTYTQADGGDLKHNYHTSGGAGWVLNEDNTTSSYLYGMSSIADDAISDVHCNANIDIPVGGFGINVPGKHLDDLVNMMTSGSSGITVGADPTTYYLPSIVDPNNYSTSFDRSWTASAFAPDYQTQTWHTIWQISWSKSNTTSSSIYNFNLYHLDTFDVTDTSLTPPDVGEYHAKVEETYSGSLILTGQYSASMVVNDCTGMLSNWNLTDNREYPWRTDSHTAFAPLVCRREVQSNITPVQGFIPALMADYRSPIYISGSVSSYAAMPWQDPSSFSWNWITASYLAYSTSSANYDGAIIGTPLLFNASGSYSSGSLSSGSSYMSGSFYPYTGSYTGIGEGWFDYYYTDIHFCNNGGGDCGEPNWEQFIYKYGGTAADNDISVSGGGVSGQYSTFMPVCSTHWIDNSQAHSIARGASITSYLSDDGVIITKWAETRLPVPSYNYFRPCGSDRVLTDETTAVAFIGGSYPLSYWTSWTELTSDKIVLLWNTGGYDGIYTGCTETTNGDGSFSVATGSLVSLLPTDYSHQLTYANGYAGIVRFPNAWAMCGRQGLTTYASGSNTVLNFLSSQTNLRTGDLVDIYNANMGALSTSSSVTRIDDVNFLVAITSSLLTSAVFAQSHGSPDYHWDDAGSKMEYRINSWNTSLRTSDTTTGTCTQSCVKSTPCHESVVCFSPNAEVFPNGNTHWLPSGSVFTADGVAGNYTNFNVEFQMVDLLWQTPLPPYNNGAPSYVQNDDGSCPNDYIDDSGNMHSYCHAPWVEAQCSVPSGSPSLPSSITISAMIQPALPGVAGYSFNESSTEPWLILNNQIANCGNPCRFPQDERQC